MARRQIAACQREDAKAAYVKRIRVRLNMMQNFYYTDWVYAFCFLVMLIILALGHRFWASDYRLRIWNKKIKKMQETTIIELLQDRQGWKCVDWRYVQ